MFILQIVLSQQLIATTNTAYSRATVEYSRACMNNRWGEFILGLFYFRLCFYNGIIFICSFIRSDSTLICQGSGKAKALSSDIGTLLF